MKPLFKSVGVALAHQSFYFDLVLEKTFQGNAKLPQFKSFLFFKTSLSS